MAISNKAEARKSSGSVPFFRPEFLCCLIILNNFLHAGLVLNTGGLKKLMASVGVCSSADIPSECLTSMYDLSATLLLISPAGFLVDYFGPRFGCITGILCNVAAVCLWSLTSLNWLHWIGAALIGLPSMFMYSAQISISELFPNKSGTLMSILAAGIDMAAVMCVILTKVAEAIGPSYMGTGFLILGAISVVIGIVVFPTTRFQTPQQSHSESGLLEDYPDQIQNHPATIRPSFVGTSRLPLMDVSPRDHKTFHPPFEGLSLIRQIISLPFLLQYIFSAFLVFGRMYFSQSAEHLFSEVALAENKTAHDAAYYVNWLNWIYGPLAMLSCPLFGVLCDTIGVHSVLAILNGLTMVVFLSVSYLPLAWQWTSIIGSVSVSSFLFSQIVIFLVKTFGIGNAGSLTAATNLLVTPVMWMLLRVSRVAATHIAVSKLIATFSVFFFSIPLAQYYITKHKSKENVLRLYL